MKETVGAPIADVPESASFGCAVANRFALSQLLDDEGDPFDIIREAEAEKKKKKDETKKTASVTEKPVKKESQKDRRVPTSGEVDAPRPAKSLQGNKYPPRGASSAAQPHGERRVAFRDSRTNDNDASLGFSIERPADQGERGGRGRGGARGRGVRGGFRSTDGFDQRGKREFERHSGSVKAGVRPEEKRGGSGQRNWGSMKDQINTAMTEGAPAEEGEEATDAAESAGKPAPDADGEVAVEMSLDEWRALQQQNKPKAEFNLRKAETVVPSDSKVIHQSKKPEGADEEEATSLRRPANDITAQLRIDFGNLARPSRGGRGRGRGGRGRGGPLMRPESTPSQRPTEKTRDPTHVPNPNDPEDFPALG